MGTVIVHPEPGFLKDVAQELLALTANPYDVEYVMWPEPGFRVPEWLFDKFEVRQVGDVGAQIADIIGALVDPNSPNPVIFEVPAEVAAQMAVGDFVEVPVVEPVKRKPGRPKKNTEGQ